MDTSKQILKSYYGYDSFRPLQQEIINHVLQRKNALVLMPTGGGKSICFQIPALKKQGETGEQIPVSLCSLVSPIFAFQKLLYCYIVTLVKQKNRFLEAVNCYL